MTEMPPPPSLADLHDLRGKAAFVTGSGSGIGRAAALRLAEAGARVCGFDIDLGGAQETTRMSPDPSNTLAMAGDVRSRTDVDGAIGAAMEAWGRLDILVNSAGIFPPSPILDLSAEGWEQVIDVNVKGTFNASQIWARYIREADGSGAIVNVASKGAYKPTSQFAHYSASKGAVVMLTKALALELGPFGIRVNAVAPGTVRTPATAKVGQAVGAAPVEVAATMPRQGRSVLDRMAEPDEIARIILFLATEWSRYMTGSIVLADGGSLLV